MEGLEKGEVGLPARHEPAEPGCAPDEPEPRRRNLGLELAGAGEDGEPSLRTRGGEPCLGEPRVSTASISSTEVAARYAFAWLARRRALEATCSPPTPEARSLKLPRREKRRGRGGESGLAPCDGGSPLTAVSEVPASFVSVRAVKSIWWRPVPSSASAPPSSSPSGRREGPRFVVLLARLRKGLADARSAERFAAASGAASAVAASATAALAAAAAAAAAATASAVTAEGKAATVLERRRYREVFAFLRAVS